MDCGWSGKTLLELIAALAILSLLTTLGVPRLSASRESTEARQFSHLLTRMLTLARTTAVASGQRTTLCLSADQHMCSKHWTGHVNILVFTDLNKNRQLDTTDILHRSQPLSLALGQGFWRGSLGRNYMRYRIDGSAVEYGRYSYCPDSGERGNFRQIVINHVGRPYTHYDGGGLFSDCP